MVRICATSYIRMMMLTVVALAVAGPPLLAQTGLELPFDGSLVGTRGQTPSSSSGVTFDAGKVNQAAAFDSGDILEYPSATNIDSQEGTLEFWYKPNWNPGTGRAYTFLALGGYNGMIFLVDGGPNLRGIFQRWASEVQVITHVGQWRADEWHHIAFTWSSSQLMLRLYLDGAMKDQWHLSAPLPAITGQPIRIGSEGGGGDADGLIDELKVSTYAKTSGQILDSYLRQVGLLSLEFRPSNLTLWRTWWRKPRLFAETSSGTIELPHDAYPLASSDPSVGAIRYDNYIVAVNGGECDISTTFGGLNATMHLTVRTPVLPEQDETIDPVLSTPMPGYIWEMPVVIVQFIPTADGIFVDPEHIGPDGNWATVEMVRGWIDQFNKRVKYGLEERSRFRGYKRPDARPSLGYRVLKIITFYEPLPPYMEFQPDYEWHQPDYDQILRRINAEYWVTHHNVKEFWVWGYHEGGIAPVESNMSSPTTGDISNSFRLNDLPVFDRTYTLYGYNFMRTQSEALHNHGHQIEAILSYVAWRQDGNTDLFWVNFAGFVPGVGMGTGRCGACHFPPNTNIDYDYMNPTLVSSDCEDWTPDNTGARTMVNVDTWGNLSYAWPGGGGFWQQTEAQFYLYWWQNMPGWDNGIRYGASEEMTNWWKFTGDWDGSITRLATEGGLHGPKQPSMTELVAEDVSGNAGETVDLVARLTRRSNGAGIGGKHVAFAVAGTAVGTDETDSNGQARLPYAIDGLPLGEHEIAAAFAGDADFAAASDTAALRVLSKYTTTMNVPDRTGTITELVTLRGYLYRTAGNVPLSGKTLEFRVDGTLLGTAVTGSNGRADYNWIISDGSATRTIRGDFAGDESHEASFGTGTLTCQSWTTKMASFDRTQRITGRTELKARLLRSDNTPLYNKQVNFYVDGTFVITRPTDTEGYARYPFYDVPDGAGAGTRTILSEWPGNGGYAAISKTATLTVLKALPYIWVHPRSVPQGGVYRLYCYFRRLYDYKPQGGKTLAFSIDGTWIADVVTADTGVARYNYDTSGLTKGDHTARCTYGGDAWVEGGFGEARLTVY